MTHPIAQHDQVLQYVKSEAFTTFVDGKISFQIIADEFEAFWRAVISQELAVNLKLIGLQEEPIPTEIQRRIILSVWTGE